MGILNLLLRGGRGDIQDPSLAERRLTTPAGWSGNGSPKHPIAYEESFSYPTTFETTAAVGGSLVLDFIAQATGNGGFLSVYKNGALSFVLNVVAYAPLAPYTSYRDSPFDSSAVGILFSVGDVIRLEPDTAVTVLSIRAWIRRQ